LNIKLPPLTEQQNIVSILEALDNLIDSTSMTIENSKEFSKKLVDNKISIDEMSIIDDKITSQEQYKEKLEKLKKSLMQKLLTGEVRVKIS
jgi:restriction endonuclease S subunit